MLRGEMQQLGQALTAVAETRKVACARAATSSPRSIRRTRTTPGPGDECEQPAPERAASRVRRLKAGTRAIVGAGKGERHPGRGAAAARNRAAREALWPRYATSRARRGATSTPRRGTEAAGLSALLEQAKQRALDLNQLEMEYRRLERTKAQSEKLYGLVLERSQGERSDGPLALQKHLDRGAGAGEPGADLPRTSRDLPSGWRRGWFSGSG
jgi:hypothetical protein